MPQIHTIRPACWLDIVPENPPDRYTLLTEDGWADQSVLFFPDRYGPVPLGMVLTAPNPRELTSKLTALRLLRRKKVLVDDGIRSTANCLVLGVAAAKPAPCAMIIGGSSSTDVWEQEVVVMILPPSPAVA